MKLNLKFYQTSAAFDQGGARGLLLNHISSQGQCELIFDSCDSVDTIGNFNEYMLRGLCMWFWKVF